MSQKNELTQETETRYTDANCNVHINSNNYGNVYKDETRKKILEQLIKENKDPSKIKELQEGADGIKKN